MSDDRGNNRLWAYALIILGALLLAANLGWVRAIGDWLWALLFIGGGALFLQHYFKNRHAWWSVIPGGILITLGVVDWLELLRPGLDTGWVFFLGVAATFGFLYLRPDGGARLNWALWPAVAALAVALLSFVTTAAGGIVAPLALIGLGIYLFTRGAKPRGDEPGRKGEAS